MMNNSRLSNTPRMLFKIRQCLQTCDCECVQFCIVLVVLHNNRQACIYCMYLCFERRARGSTPGRVN